MGHSASAWTHFDVVGDFAFIFLQNYTVQLITNEDRMISACVTST